MDIAELVLKYVQAVAWPGVAILAIGLFRRELSALFARITEASMFGATVKLENRAKEAADRSDEIPELADPAAHAVPVERPQSTHAAAGSMMFAWNAVESAVAEVGHELDLPGAVTRSTAAIMRVLGQRRILSEEALVVWRDLQAIRNQLVHRTSDVGLSDTAAENFVEAAYQLAAALKVTLHRIRAERETS